MKKSKMAIATILLGSLLVMGCNVTGNDEPSDDITKIRGNLLILQAYGNGNGDSPSGVSRSFVELYNISDEPINLDGIGLYYANGIRGNDITADESWKRLALAGTIPAKGSFLVLGAEHEDLRSTRYKIAAGSGDINDDLVLNRRGFKVALIKSAAELTVQNPFISNEGDPVSGYIDMVGALNNPDASPPDHIFGYETAPARNSAAEAVRRQDLVDTDDNSKDFIAARYAATGTDAFTEEMLELRSPRNSSAGAWSPFAKPGDTTGPDDPEPKEDEDDTDKEDGDSEAGDETDKDDNDNDNGQTTTVSSQGKLLILQAYGSSSDAAGASHSFVELYNITDTAINLADHFLWYADGTSVANNATPNTNTQDGSWKKITLSGSIPGKGSFLIVGPRQNQNKTGSSAARYQVPDDYGDINDAQFTLSNRAFKVTLLQGSTQLTEARQNPFTSNNGKPVSGYIDMVGAANSYSADGSERDRIFGFETAPARNSASVTVRRTDLIDTDDNSKDFESIDYRAWSSSNPERITDEQLEVYRPKNSAVGAWDPFAEPADPPPPVISENTLLIFQVFGMHAENDSAPTHSFIELYNNSDTPINLSTYSVHWANGPSSNGNAPAEKDVWHKINLSGSIPAKGSYLILGKQVVDATTIANSSINGSLNLTTLTADINDNTFLMSNRSYKVALMANQNTITEANPWGDPACIDLVSAINTSGTDSVTAAKGEDDLAAVNGASGGANTISKQKSWRRTSLTVVDVTLTDFTSKQYSTISTDDIAKFRPRTATETVGGYDPEF